MAITKVNCGDDTSVLLNSVNELIDREEIFIEDFGASESSPNSAPAIMSALAALKKGQILTSFSKQVTLTETITHTFDSTQEFASVRLICDFIFDTANTEGGIYLDGAGFTFGEITIGAVAFKEFSFHDTAGADVSTGVGVEVRNFWQTDIDIYQTMNYMVGTRAVGGDLASSGNGFALSNLRIRKAFCPKITGAMSLNITTIPFLTTRGYFNSNRVTCNFMRGQNGIVFTKGSLQDDEFNGNTILDTSVENIVDIGIDFEYSQGNMVRDTRFEGGNLPLFYVRDSADSALNVVEIVGSPDEALFDMGGSGSVLTGNIRDVNGVYMYGQTLAGPNSSDPTGNDITIHQANRVNSATPNNTVFWGGISGQDRWEKYAGGVKDNSGNDMLFGLLDPLGSIRESGNDGSQQLPRGLSVVSLALNGASDLSLTMNEDREINGFVMKLEIRSVSNGIEIKKSTGSVSVALGVITTTGLYDLIYISDVWRVSKVGEVLS